MTGLDTTHTVPAERLEFINKRRVGGAPATHRLTIHRDGQPTKDRTYHVVSRMGPNHDLGVFNNNVSAVERALLERYFLCNVDGTFLPPIPVVKGAFDTAELRGIRAHVVRYVRLYATVLDLGQVVARYTGAKRRIYASALKSLCRKAICRKDAELRPFTKFEKQSLLKACRIINPRSPRYNLMLGKYLKHTEKLFYAGLNEAWESVTDHTVVKGLNVVESAGVIRAKWDRFKNPVALGLDATKFDMHVSREALAYEHSFYTGVFPQRELRKLLAWQLNNRGVAYCPDGRVKFAMPGTRSSGDLNTSLGNCIIMCSAMLALVRGLGVEAELCNNGDDCVLIFESEHLGKIQAAVEPHFSKLGFRMQAETPVYEFEQLEFCQSRPVWNGRSWTMVRNLLACLKKDPMCLVPIQNDKVWRKWLGAVGQCGAALVPGLPVLQSFYRAFERAGVTSGDKFIQHVFKNTSMVERSTNLSQGDREILPAARASFCTAFGVTADMQLALEHYYDNMTIGGVSEVMFGKGMVEVQPPAFLRHL